MVKKKEEGKYRLVCDFRKLNADTVKDKYPLPRIDESIGIVLPLVQCSGSSEEVRREAQWAVCRWAAFHANLRAKAAGKNLFSKEDWQDFVRSAGFGLVKELTEGKYQVLKTFIDRLEAKPDRLRELMSRVKAGEQLVESTNKFPLWHKSPNVRETASSTKSLSYQTPPALMATQSSPQDTSGTQHHSNTGSDDKVVAHFKNFHLNYNSTANLFYADHS